ncbi:unnamed protein product [Ambrosiozyma monospora]|uniref:Unnamed protein product n=1 Tax=Ambrosiozyma monospora TaxID=43982 RepID=A0ACB5T6C1_AMBMO|nr:unnamed protein product [Ambrosiozyma monospora]
MGYTRVDYQNNKQQTYGPVSFGTNTVPVTRGTTSSSSIRSFKSGSSVATSTSSPSTSTSANDSIYSIKLIYQLMEDQKNGQLNIDKTLDIILDPTFCTDIAALKEKMNLGIEENNSDEDQSQLELISVITICKITRQLNRILKSASNNALEQKFDVAVGLYYSVFGLLSYFYQLPQEHMNFGFKKFGCLLCSSRVYLFESLLTILLYSPKFNYSEKSKMKKMFTLMVSFFLVSKASFDALMKFFDSRPNFEILAQVFCDTTAGKPGFGLLGLFKVFNLSKVLEQADISSSTWDARMINQIVPNSCDLSVMKTIQLLKQLQLSLNRITRDPDSTAELFTVIQLYHEGALFRQAIVLFCHHDPSLLESLFSQSASPASFAFLNGKDISAASKLKYYLLSKVAAECVLEFPMNAYPDSVVKLLNKVNNSNFNDCLGYSVETNNIKYKPNQFTMSVLFELVDQNMHLDLVKEKNYLQLLKAALVTINANVNTDSEFLSMQKLLNDVGSRLSLHALLETIQFILASHLNELVVANKYSYKNIPSYYKEEFGFEFIVPVGKSNFLFEDNLNFGVKSTEKPRSKSLELCKDIENTIEFHQQYCTELIQQFNLQIQK